MYSESFFHEESKFQNSKWLKSYEGLKYQKTVWNSKIAVVQPKRYRLGCAAAILFQTVTLPFKVIFHFGNIILIPTFIWVLTNHSFVNAWNCVRSTISNIILWHPARAFPSSSSVESIIHILKHVLFETVIISYSKIKTFLEKKT